MSRRRGFTLLEVMVALAILGVGLSIVIQAMSLSLRAGRHARELSVATLLLRDRMAEVRREGFPDEGRTDGAFPAPYDGLRWVVDVSVEVMPELEEFDGLKQDEKRTSDLSNVYAHIAPGLVEDEDDDEDRVREMVLRRVVVSIHRADEDSEEPVASAHTFIARRGPIALDEDSGERDRTKRLREEREDKSREALGDRASAGAAER